MRNYEKFRARVKDWQTAHPEKCREHTAADSQRYRDKFGVWRTSKWRIGEVVVDSVTGQVMFTTGKCYKGFGMDEWAVPCQRPDFPDVYPVLSRRLVKTGYTAEQYRSSWKVREQCGLMAEDRKTKLQVAR